MGWKLAFAVLIFAASGAGAEVTHFPAHAGETDEEPRELRVYSSLDVHLALPLIEAFQASRPDVAVAYDEMLTAPMAERVMTETDSGAATADLVFSSAMDLVVKLANDGYGRPVSVPEAAIWPRWANWRNTAFALTFEPGVLVYHRPAFPDGPPDTRTELIDWLATAPKGKIGTYDVTKSGVGYLFFLRDLEHFADSWLLVGAMGDAGLRVFPTSQDIISRVSSGDLLIGYNILGSYAADQVAQLPDLGMTLPRDFVVVVSRVALVPRAARSPGLGEAFLSFLMSREGQTLLAEKLRLPAVSLEVAGADTAGAMSRVFGDRLRPVPVSPGLLAYLDRAKRDRVLARWKKVLDRR